MSGLADASVALDGGIVATGYLRYPADPGGVFPAAQGGEVHVSRGRWLQLRPCDAPRDATGFRRVDRMGAVLGVPDELAVPIRHALKSGVESALDLHLPYQAGWLASSDKPIRHDTQPLSDWRLSLREAEGTISMHLSAALFAPPAAQWSASWRNWWGDAAPKLEAVLTIDAATRIACYGSYVPSSKEAGEGELAIPVPTRWPDLRLGTTPVGTFEMYGTDAHGQWASIYTSDRTLVFSPDIHIRRLPSGFVARGVYGWPRIWLQGVTLDTIADLFDPHAKTAAALTATISLEEGRFGHLGQPSYREEPPAPTEHIVAARLAARLDAAGLTIDYRLMIAVDGQTPRREPLLGCVMIGWEVLILRFPRFAIWRDAALD